MTFDPAALDRHITGNYGEDQFKDYDEDQPDDEGPSWEGVVLATTTGDRSLLESLVNTDGTLSRGKATKQHATFHLGDGKGFLQVGVTHRGVTMEVTKADGRSRMLKASPEEWVLFVEGLLTVRGARAIEEKERRERHT